MRSCKEIAKLMSPSNKEKLSLMQRMEMTMHLLICEMCRKYKKQMQYLSQAYKKVIRSKNAEDSENVKKLEKKIVSEITKETGS